MDCESKLASLRSITCKIAGATYQFDGSYTTLWGVIHYLVKHKLLQDLCSTLKYYIMFPWRVLRAY